MVVVKADALRKDKKEMIVVVQVEATSAGASIVGIVGIVQIWS